jgi:uncharacterized membrane protein
MPRVPLIYVAILLAGCGLGNPEKEAAKSVGKPELVAHRDASEPVAETTATPAAKTRPGPKASACLVQDGTPIPANRFRAVGTEPFWGARIEGRCVTYSHPDDQAGTRVWTRWSGKEGVGVWKGSLGGKPFVLRIRAEPGCSDGMSDERYPLAVSLTVGGEERQGCAVPI